MDRTVSIARIDASALPRVRELAYRIWPECFAGILKPEEISLVLADVYALPELEADMAQRGHLYWIVQVDGADAGYASAYREADRLWIKKLYLLDSSRGLGLGKRLIAVAIDALPGARRLALYVNDGNAGAIAFYRSQGFAIEATVPVQMGPCRFNDHVMTRALTA